MSDVARSDVIVLIVESPCDVPRCLLDLPALVDASSRHHDHDWWQKLTRLIDDTHRGIRPSLHTTTMLYRINTSWRQLITLCSLVILILIILIF